ncbi:MAG: amidohydrolase family protein [Alphaproteobacteria bacterium]|nr:amidohydrolase family protein [Alphaproteobacteria bacterium]MCB9698898.1 amidohydrolase family protein [Alphaproteobacteria bacterium]
MRDPDFLEARIDAIARRLPPHLEDRHQSLPAEVGVEAFQLVLQERLGLSAVHLRSGAPGHDALGDEGIASLAARDPDRTVVSRYLDPRAPGVLAAGDVSVCPAVGWRPDDPAFEPVWAELEARGARVLARTGVLATGHPGSSVLGEPLAWDPVCRRFPRLRLQLCGAGGAVAYEHVARMLAVHPSVRADVSGPGVRALDRWLRLQVDVDWSRVAWGNDGHPLTYPASLTLLIHTLDRHGAGGLLHGLLRPSPGW